MNKERRGRIAKFLALLEDTQYQLEAIQDEEQEAYDNLPMSLSCSDRAETMEAALDSLESAISSLEDAVSSLQEVVEG